MVNINLLYESLRRADSNINSIKYNKSIFLELFDKYDSFKMEEEFYCCEGLSRRCYLEIVEEGNWEYTLEDVKLAILKNIKCCKKYLYNSKRYGGNRLHINQNNNECYVFIYMRDILGVDYNIWFTNNK